jgi:hypothetical protein
LRRIRIHLLSLSALILVICPGLAQKEPEVGRARTQTPTTERDKKPDSLSRSTGEKSTEAAPPGYSTARMGGLHDFDYFVGGWTTRQRRLKARGLGSNDWEEFPGTLCMSLYLDGMATVDELYFPTKASAGLTLRTFDPKVHQWSIYWVSSLTGKLDPIPVVGGFEGDRGEFYAEDHDNGRPVKVRYMWNKLDHDHARWEQAFSYDNRTWETNWTADFSRADAGVVCRNGRPKR